MSSSSAFQQALAEGVLVFDGAMGTEIYRHHVFTNRCFDELCLVDEKLIRGIHADYCEAGAEFAITQPVFDPEALLRFLDEVGDCRIPIVAGIWPLASYRNALFMQNEVPGVEIPESVMQRMESAESREDQLAMGVTIAQESVRRVHQRVAGIQVSAPFGKIATALAVIEGWDEAVGGRQ